jgi:hypothetical protein
VEIDPPEEIIPPDAPPTEFAPPLPIADVAPPDAEGVIGVPVSPHPPMSSAPAIEGAPSPTPNRPRFRRPDSIRAS